MFSRKALLPVDIELQTKDPKEVLRSYLHSSDADDEMVREEKEKQIARLERVKANIEAAQNKQKEDYDRKQAMPQHYQVGALVLHKDHTQKKRQGGKLDERWLGPFRIHKVLRRSVHALS